MPATLPTPSLDTITNYPPALAASLKALYDSGDTVLILPVTFNTADAATIFTVPANLRVQIGRAFWEVTQSWTGGTSSAIGISSSNASYNTKGDILGGASGDLAAGLTASAPVFKGTIGAKVASQGVVVLVGGDVLRFDRIASAFTAGAANVIVPAQLLPAS